MRNLFSYKNLNSYGYLYDFENTCVLSLIDSGDDYLVSLLNGASKIDLFDKSIESYNYLLFKIEAIKNFSYDEFYKYFLLKKLNDKYLEDKVLNNCDIMHINIVNSKIRKDLRYDDGEFLPYLDKKTYYKLQSILKSLDYPLFIECNMWKLSEHIKFKYDLLLTSCVFDDLYQRGRLRGVKNYKKLLKSLDVEQIQAFYCNGFLSDELEKEFLRCGYDLDYVENGNKRDTVMSLVRR